MSDVTWTRSPHSGPDGCVEARRVGSVVEVREGLFGDRSLVQVWEPWEWDDLLAAVKRGPAGGVDEPYRLVATSGDPLVYLGTVRHQTAYGRLLFDAEEWGAFARGVDAGQFDWDRLARSETSSGVGGRSGVGDAPAAAATGAGGGAVLPVPVAAQDLPEGSPAESPGCNPAPAGTGVLSLSATPSPPTSQGTNLQRAHAIVLSQLRGRASKIEQAEQIVADLHDAGLLVDDVAADADDMLRQAAAPLVPVEPGSAPPDCACWACLAWHRGIVS